jgi:hypothetical protein
MNQQGEAFDFREWWWEGMSDAELDRANTEWQAEQDAAAARAKKWDAEMAAIEAERDADCKARNVCPKCDGEGGQWDAEEGRSGQVWYACYACGQSGTYYPRAQA